jgi:hypothetical protein
MRQLLALTGLLAVLVLTLTAAPVSAGSAPRTVASGSFTLLGPDFGLPNGTNRSFAFTVQQSSQGTVTGQAQVVSFSSSKVHGAVNCFAEEGNQAIVGGTITFDTGDPGLVGTPFAFAIQDNPDVSTFFFFGLDFGASACTGLLPALGEPDLASLLNDQGLPITTGNIVIHQTG